jgi:hypothetical protein
LYDKDYTSEKDKMQEEHKEYVSIIEKENIKKITEMGVK